MFQSNKAQTSIEFIILIAILLLIGFYFSGSIYKTFDSNYVIHVIKNQTLQTLSENDCRDVLVKVNYELDDSHIVLTLDLKRTNTSDFVLTPDNYISTIEDIKNRTSFTEVSINFNYIT